MTASSILPSVESSEMGLQDLARVYSLFPGFFNGMILAFLHWLGMSPSRSDVRNKWSTLSLTTDQSCLHTIAGRPSSPGAFHGLADRTFCSISSIVRSGMCTGAR